MFCLPGNFTVKKSSKWNQTPVYGQDGLTGTRFPSGLDEHGAEKTGKIFESTV